MKKITVCILSLFAFLFFNFSKVEAIEYNGSLGFTHSASYTEFYFVSDNDSIETVKVNITNVSEPKTLTLTSNGVYIYSIAQNLQGEEYYYTVCYEDSTCQDIIDPFAMTVNRDGTKNVIVDAKSISVEGWSSISNIVFNEYEKSIYAIEDFADFVEQLVVVADETGSVPDDSYFARLTFSTKYNMQSDRDFNAGINYIRESNSKYIEIGNLYDENNYFAPNKNYSSKRTNVSSITELKQMISALKNIEKNVIARTNFLTPSENMKKSLSVFSNDYLTNDGKINLANPMMQRYIKDVYKYWVTEYKVDGFYIEDSNLYGKDFLSSLTENLKKINSNLFIYTNSNADSEYYTSDELQTTLIGSLDNNTVSGIINGDYSKESFEKLVNLMYSGYYKDQSKYANVSKVINNIGSLKGLDIYSKLKLVEGNSADPLVIKAKVNLLLYTIYSSAGIPRLVAGNEFLNTSRIATEDVNSTSEEYKVCDNDNLCYAKGSYKKFNWGDLVNHSSELSNLIYYRRRYSYQYPSRYAMERNIKTTIDESLFEKGILYLTIEYKANAIGDFERTIFLVNYSSESVELDHLSERDYSKVVSLVGNVTKNEDKTLIGGLTVFTFTETKVNNVPVWVYIVVTIGLFLFIFGLRFVLVKVLKQKRGIDYNEYMKQQRIIKKENKKKKIKTKAPSIFETYLSDEPIFNRKKWKNKDKVKNSENNVSQENENVEVKEEVKDSENTNTKEENK